MWWGEDLSPMLPGENLFQSFCQTFASNFPTRNHSHPEGVGAREEEGGGWERHPLFADYPFTTANTSLLRFACAAYRRNTNFIRVPTTVIGLIDASVSIKVAVNYGNYKNRLGAYHAPIHTFLDFTFLRSLPMAQVRNGFAELIKISSCSHLEVFDLLDKYCEDLIEKKFGRADGSSDELRKAADVVRAIPSG